MPSECERCSQPGAPVYVITSTEMEIKVCEECGDKARELLSLAGYLNPGTIHVNRIV